MDGVVAQERSGGAGGILFGTVMARWMGFFAAGGAIEAADDVARAGGGRFWAETAAGAGFGAGACAGVEEPMVAERWSLAVEAVLGGTAGAASRFRDGVSGSCARGAAGRDKSKPDIAMRLSRSGL